jgi:hypothetical protein
MPSERLLPPIHVCILHTSFAFRPQVSSCSISQPQCILPIKYVHIIQTQTLGVLSTSTPCRPTYIACSPSQSTPCSGSIVPLCKVDYKLHYLDGEIFFEAPSRRSFCLITCCPYVTEHEVIDLPCPAVSRYD